MDSAFKFCSRHDDKSPEADEEGDLDNWLPIEDVKFFSLSIPYADLAGLGEEARSLLSKECGMLSWTSLPGFFTLQCALQNPH